MPSARCKFLNYRRNMACYECEHKRPPDEYTSNEIESPHMDSTRSWPKRGTSTRVPEVSGAWNFDFDDDESDGADIAAFEFADSSKGGLEDRNSKGTCGRRSDLHERKPTRYSSRTGLDDFDDEDDDLDNYEIDSSGGGMDSGVARRSFSELEGSDLEDYRDFIHSKKNSKQRSRNYLTNSDNDDDDGPYFQHRQGDLKSDSDSDADDSFRSYSPKRSQRALVSEFESDGGDYFPSTKNYLKGGRFDSRGDFGGAREANRSRRYGKVHDQEDSRYQSRPRKGIQSGRYGKVHDQEDSWDQSRQKGRFGNDGGFRGSQWKDMKNNDRSYRRGDRPYKANEGARFRSRRNNNSG